MVKIKYTFTMQVENGPSLNIPGNYDVEIVESGGVPIPKGGQEVTIRVQPLKWDSAEFIVIQSSLYDETDLTYSIGNAKDVPLNRAHFIIGNSLARLLGSLPGDLKVKNKTDSDVTVSMVVGRKATA